ncbi:MAG: hypothetical protein ACYS8S_03905 [Planctomycetota bacterium]
MHPELFEIPFLHISVKSYGTLMVIGFLAALWIMRRLMKGAGQDPDRGSSGRGSSMSSTTMTASQAVRWRSLPSGRAVWNFWAG